MIFIWLRIPIDSNFTFDVAFRNNQTILFLFQSDGDAKFK